MLLICRLLLSELLELSDLSVLRLLDEKVPLGLLQVEGALVLRQEVIEHGQFDHVLLRDHSVVFLDWSCLVVVVVAVFLLLLLLVDVVRLLLRAVLEVGVLDAEEKL